MQRSQHLRLLVTLALAISVFGTNLDAVAECSYARSCWSAQLSTNFHSVSGTVTIIDAQTLLVEDFTYDGGGPAVYFYLGADESSSAFDNGLGIPPLLSGTSYDGETLMLTLPAGDTLDGYNAVSVWCEDFSINFGSGTFQPGPPAGDVDCDCDVDLADLSVLLGAFGSCSGDANYSADADLTGDDCVDLADLSVLLGNFGMGT